jgi:hypothetical protein
MSSIFRYIGEPPYALWSIWHQLSTLQQWLVYTLCALCIYSGYCVVSTIARLHSVKHLGSDAAARCMGVLRARCTNLRYAIVAELYLSGIVLFSLETPTRKESTKQHLIIGFSRPVRKRSPLNRSTAWKLPLACQYSGNRDYRKIATTTP